MEYVLFIIYYVLLQCFMSDEWKIYLYPVIASLLP